MDLTNSTHRKVSPERLTELSAAIAVHFRQPNLESMKEVQDFVAVLREFEGDECAELRIVGFLDAAKYFYVSGRPFFGVSSAHDAVSLADRIGNLQLQRKALNSYGILCNDTGNLPDAVMALARALHLAQSLNDPAGECAVWNNIGLTYLQYAQYRDAVGCFNRSIEIAESDPAHASTRIASLRNLARAHLYLEDYADGLLAVDRAIRETPEPTSSQQFLGATISEHHYTRLLLEVDDVKKAKERSSLAMQYAEKANTMRAQIIGATAAGLYEVRVGLIDVGLSRLTAALEQSRIIRSTLRDTLIALVRAHEFANEPDRALKYLQELLEHTRKGTQENALNHLALAVHQFAPETEVAIRRQSLMTLERHRTILQGQVAERELNQAQHEMLERLAVAAELRDDSTGEHSYRVGKMAALIAAEYGCDDDTNFQLDLAGRLHDIGKIGVPDAILLKPGRLNEAEIQIMRAHTVVGAELLAKSNIPSMQMAEEIARYHHEWWDGNGYPSGISGTAIPLAARIVAIADVFDALTHKRPYKEAWPVEDALSEIEMLKDRQFDPALCEIFLALVPRLQSIHGDLDAFLGQAANASKFIQARQTIEGALNASMRNKRI